MTKKVKTHFSWRALELDVDCINAGRVDRANHIQISVLFGVNGIMPMGVADAPNAHVPVIYMPVYLPALGGRWLSGHWWERQMDVEGVGWIAKSKGKSWAKFLKSEKERQKIGHVKFARKTPIANAKGNLQNSCMHFSILEWRGDVYTPHPLYPPFFAFPFFHFPFSSSIPLFCLPCMQALVFLLA